MLRFVVLLTIGSPSPGSGAIDYGTTNGKFRGVDSGFRHLRREIDGRIGNDRARGSLPESIAVVLCSSPASPAPRDRLEPSGTRGIDAARRVDALSEGF